MDKSSIQTTKKKEQILHGLRLLNALMNYLLVSSTLNYIEWLHSEQKTIGLASSLV